MSLFTRNLAKCGQDIELAGRDTRTINGLPQEVFTNAVTVKAIVKTPNGVSVFDDTNTETGVTHELCILYVAGVTAEKWVKLKGKRLRILQVKNCCEKDKTLVLMCTERGVDTKVVNDA